MSSPRFSFSRLQRRASDGRGPLPLSPVAVAVRENLAERRHGLAELDPRAIDLGAQVLSCIHEVLNGRMTELRGCGSPEYRRRQLLGRDGLPIEEVCYLAVHVPEAVLAGLQPLVAALGARLEPLEPDEAAPLPVVLAHVVRSSSAMVAGIIADIAGGLTPEEAVECDALLHTFKQALASLEAALHNEALGERR